MNAALTRLVGPLLFGLLLATSASAWGSGKEAIGKRPMRTDRYDDPLPDGAIARLGSVRFHHPRGIIAAAYSLDSSTILAVGMGDKHYSLRFWDAASGKQLTGFELEGQAGFNGQMSLQAVAFVPNREIIALCFQHGVELRDIKTGKLIRTLAPKGNNCQIVSFAIAPDGKTLAAGCLEWKDDNPIRVWEVDTGRELAPFAGRGTSFSAVTFSADGKRLFCGPTGGSYGINGKTISASICVWDVAGRKLIRQLDRSEGNIAFAPSGEIIAFESAALGGIQLVSVATDRTVCTIAGRHTFYKFAPDGKTIITLDDRQSLREWDAATGKALRTFGTHLPTNSRLIGFSPDGKRLALMDGGWGKDGSIRQWNVLTAEELRPFNGHQDEVGHLAYSPDGRLLASGSKDRTVRLWDLTTGEQMHLLEGHQGEIFAVAFAPDGKTLASMSADGTTRLWDVAAGRLLVSFENPPGRKEGQFRMPRATAALSFAADGKTLTGGAADGMLAVWDVQARKEIRRKVLDKNSAARPVFLPNLGAVVTVSGGEWDFEERASESLHVWNIATGKEFQEMPLRSTRENGYGISCTGIAASPDERMLVSSQTMVSQSLRGPVYHDPILCLWERVTGREVLRIKDAMARAMTFSPNSRLLAVDDGGVRFFHGQVGSKSFGSTISLWDTLTGTHQARLTGHTAQVRCIAFAPDGKTLASAGADHTILVWNTPPLKETKADAVKPAPEQPERWWDDLGAADAAGAHRAGARLVFNPGAAVALIRDRFRPATAVDAKIIVPLINALDSPQFALREKAIRQLEAMEDLAEPALRAALADSPSLEKRRRLESLLEKAAVHSDRQVHKLRALTVLERIANPEARQVIESLAKGTPDARITREAQASLRRLGAAVVPEKK